MQKRQKNICHMILETNYKNMYKFDDICLRYCLRHMHPLSIQGYKLSYSSSPIGTVAWVFCQNVNLYQFKYELI